jgi:hypothetical protein
MAKNASSGVCSRDLMLERLRTDHDFRTKKRHECELLVRLHSCTTGRSVAGGQYQRTLDIIAQIEKEEHEQ